LMVMNREQRKLIEAFEKHTGYEFMGKDRIQGHRDFIEKWDRNIQWLKDVADEADSMLNEYRTRHLTG